MVSPVKRSALCVIALLVTSTAMATSDGPDYLRVRNVKSNDVLHIRSEPTAQSPVVGQLKPDQRGIENIGCLETMDLIHYLKTSGAPKTTVDSVRPGQTWCRVASPGNDRVIGWVNGRFVEEDRAPSPNVSLRSLDNTRYKVRGLQTGESVQISSCPGEKAITCGTIAEVSRNGTVLTGTGEQIDGWLSVQIKDKIGWIHSSHVTTGNDILPDCRDVTYFEVIGVAENDRLAVRSGPGVQFAKVGELYPGQLNIENRMDQVQSSACETGWIKISRSWIDSSGNEVVIDGWVNAKYLKPSTYQR